MSSNIPVHDFGDRVRITGTWSLAGVATAPTVVRWRVRAPNGAETPVITSTDIYTLEAGQTGTYSLLFTPPTAGEWVVRGEGLGTVEQAFEVVFRVKAPRVQSASVTP